MLALLRCSSTLLAHSILAQSQIVCVTLGFWADGLEIANGERVGKRKGLMMWVS